MPDDRERHDRLFRRTFENVENAAVELKVLLPKSISEQVDWASLHVESGALRAKGKRLNCDMLYSARLSGKRALFYLLLEHQSSVDALMPFRMITYVLNILERQLNQSARALPLPVVIPAVIHHSEEGWKNSTDMHSLFEPEHMGIGGVKELVPQMKFLLDDVSHASNDELLARASAPPERIVSLALWARRDGRNRARFLQNFDAWLETIGALWQLENAPHLLEDVFWYITLADSGLTHQDLNEAAQRASFPAKESIMSIAEELRQEGRKEGRQEGRQEAQMELLVKQLQLKFGELSDDAAHRVASAAPHELETWAERILTATSLEEVLQ